MTVKRGTVLLDTDVFSYFLNSADARAEVYRHHIENRTIAISFVTVGELYSGALKKKWGSHRLDALKAALKSVVIVPSDNDICWEYARLKTGTKTATGSQRTFGANDLWIAACALSHKLPLISNNRRHFEGIARLDLISEAP